MLPILLPAELNGGFLGFLEVFGQAHNLKIAGSNPAPRNQNLINMHTAILTDSGFFVSGFLLFLWSNIQFIGGIVAATLFRDTEMKSQDH